MRRIALLAAAVGLLLPFLASAPAQAQATRTWVSGVGDDANPCSRTAPCKTFAGAISKTAAGGEIVNGANTTDKVVLRNLVIQGTVGTTQGSNGIRFLAGQELHLDRVVIQGQSGFCVDFNKSTLGILYVKDSYFTECATGINITSTATAVAEIQRSTFAGVGNGVSVTGAGSAASVTKSAFENGSNCMIASTSGASISASDNMFVNC